MPAAIYYEAALAVNCEVNQMIELFEEEKMGENRQSSKGNQLKWKKGDTWHKADYAGYEGLAEYMVSGLLKHTTLKECEYIHYQTEEIKYHHSVYRGCASENFLPTGWQLITLERLFQNCYGESLNRCIYRIPDVTERVRFLVDQSERITGLKDFGVYICKMLTLDAFFLNEDRHTHNIAVLLDEMGGFHYCPFFDHGAALFSDTTMDYPLTVNAEECLRIVKSKTFCTDFEEQLDAAEALYGYHVKFSFDWRDIAGLLERENYYPKEIKDRVEWVLTDQRRKYRYLFS